MNTFTRFAAVMLAGLLLSNGAMAKKNNLLHVDNTLEPTVHNWGSGITNGDFFLAGAKNEFFNIYNFTLNSSSAISFYTFVSKGMHTFAPLKMNLFSGTYNGQNNLNIATINNLKISGATQIEAGHLNLFQQSISNGMSCYSGNLAAGSYYLSLSGQPKSSFSSYVLSGYKVSAVPEPSELALMLSGLGLVGWTAIRRKRKSQP